MTTFQSVPTYLRTPPCFHAHHLWQHTSRRAFFAALLLWKNIYMKLYLISHFLQKMKSSEKCGYGQKLHRHWDKLHRQLALPWRIWSKVALGAKKWQVWESGAVLHYWRETLELQWQVDSIGGIVCSIPSGFLKLTSMSSFLDFAVRNRLLEVQVCYIGSCTLYTRTYSLLLSYFMSISIISVWSLLTHTAVFKHILSRFKVHISILP